MCISIKLTRAQISSNFVIINYPKIQPNRRYLFVLELIEISQTYIIDFFCIIVPFLTQIAMNDKCKAILGL